MNFAEAAREAICTGSRKGAEEAQVYATLDVADAIRDLAAAWREDDDPGPGELAALAEVVEFPRDGVRDPDSATGWAPGRSPRSIFGDEH